ncbi:MAG TPA: replicative DNA helicase [Acidobacteriota bacterium]|nr:replicative DNA helicase [Acidobacteriota bacterium]
MATRDITLEKTLPHNLDAERSVLGAVLLDDRLFNSAGEILTKDDFYTEGHKKIYVCMEGLSAASRPIDLITLKDELIRADDLEAVGGAAYISSLIDGVPRISNIEHYARIVKDKAVLRRLIYSANEIILRSFSTEEDALDILEQAEKSIFEISQDNIQTGFIEIGKLLGPTITSIEQRVGRQELVTGVGTGFYEIDSLTSGFQKCDLVIIAARPGLGKTSFCLNVAAHAALHDGLIVGIFSLEMAGTQIVNRLLCSEARVNAVQARNGTLGREGIKKIVAAAEKLAEAKIYIDDTAGISIVEMRSKARRLKAEVGLDLLVVDYLQLMSGRGRYENRQQEISAISRALKGLAKEINIPVVAISQLSRAPEQRRGALNKPQLSDLRESGSIEQDADLVMFLYKPSAHAEESEEFGDDRILEMIIGKQRNGPTGVARLVFLGEYTKFENLRET